MSIDSIAGSVQGITANVSKGADLASRLAKDLGFGGGGPAPQWYEQLYPASFRGVPFAVLSEEGRFGRRLAVHEYPYRDKPWAEDIGRSTRKLGLVGFIVENSAVYGGGDVISQRDAMIAACEQSGPGTLIHPTLGELTVSVPDGGLGIASKWDRGRYFELNFTFVESGADTIPSIDYSTGDDVTAAADAADSSALSDFMSAIGKVKQVSSTVAGYARKVQKLVNDATNLYHMVGTIAGQFGRFFGSSSQPSRISGLYSAPATVSSLIAQGAASRANVAAAASVLSLAGESLTDATGASFAQSAQALSAALLAATTDPADAMRLYADLAGDTSTSPLQSPLGDLFRRAAVTSLARASTSYQPVSYEDAANTRSIVTNPLDNEILIAADQSEDATYMALRALRQKVVKDLNIRGAGLPTTEVFSMNATLPSLVVGQRLYQDPGRADELVAEANPVHPAFMPVRFRGLSR